MDSDGYFRKIELIELSQLVKIYVHEFTLIEN